MRRVRTHTHLLATPCPVDDVWTLCGLRLTPGNETPRGDRISGTPEVITCVACLRTKVSLLAYRVRELEGKGNDALP